MLWRINISYFYDIHTSTQSHLKNLHGMALMFHVLSLSMRDRLLNAGVIYIIMVAIDSQATIAYILGI